MVSEAYADPEDFTVITPKFKTNFKYFDYYDNSYRIGSFEKSLMNLDILQKKDYYNVSAYSSYMYSWSKLVSVENTLSQNDSSILVYGDSFRYSVVPFLSTGVKKVYSMSEGFTGSMYTFLEKCDPDLVIIIVYPPRITSFNNGIK